MNPFVFISWSGSKSKEYALILKELLGLEFNFKEDEIFVSDVGLNGSRGWLETVREKASGARILITCITSENKKSPWIHYEVGIGSYMEQPVTSKKIIPVLFDMETNELDGNLTMLSYHQMVCEDNCSHSNYYKRLLQKLIYQVDSYLVECMVSNTKDVAHLKIYQYKAYTSVTGCKVNSFAKKLMTICEFYSHRDFFISRPIMGIDEIKRISIDNMLKRIVEKTDKRVFFAENSSVSSDLPTSRLAIIKGCSSFILIYPNVQYTETVSPSSCLIELGMALALNKRINIFIENGTGTPRFLEFIQEKSYYYDVLEVEEKINKVIK